MTEDPRQLLQHAAADIAAALSAIEAGTAPTWPTEPIHRRPIAYATAAAFALGVAITLMVVHRSAYAGGAALVAAASLALAIITEIRAGRSAKLPPTPYAGKP